MNWQAFKIALSGAGMIIFGMLAGNHNVENKEFVLYCCGVAVCFAFFSGWLFGL